MSALAPLSDGVQAVSDLYAERCDIKRDDDWYLLKLQEELGELVQAHLRLTGRGRLKGQSTEALQGARADEAPICFASFCSTAAASTSIWTPPSRENG